MTDPLITLGGLPLFGTSEGGVFWQIPLDGLKGWWGAPASTIAPVQRTRADGAWAGDAWLAARNLSLNGVIDAPTRALAVTALEALTASASLSETTMTVVDVGVVPDGAIPIGGLTIVDNGDGTITLSWPDTTGETITIAEDRVLSAQVRRTDELIVQWVTDKVANFSIQLIATDPRKTGTMLTGTTGLPSSSGGLTFPTEFPVTFDAETVAGHVSLENPGNTTGKVTFRIDGPITGPVVTHVNSGRSIVFASSISIPAGSWLDVDMDARTVLENGTASRSAWVTDRGWSGFSPGSNVWAFTAAGGSGTLTVNAYPSWN